MKILEAFAGIGAWRKALINLNICHESVGFIENNKYAIQAYCQLYNDSIENNYNDITKLNYKELPDHDLFCYSPPCQSFSVAGKRKGLEDIRGTLFFYAAKIIEIKKPKYAIMENVKGLLSDDNGKTIEIILNRLDGAGYNNYMMLLNAKDYGIPQNRERVFIVSIRKDFDDLTYEFPKKENIGYNALQNILQINIDDIMIVDDGASKTYQSVMRNCCPCLKASRSNYLILTLNRKLTSLECFRLQGFSDDDYFKLEEISDPQKYKLAGNSIVVNVCEAIFKQLFNKDKRKKWLF
jgi:DNA (cytosine-5)-methyltransferase 1